MGTSCFRAQTENESVFNVLRKITNTMRDLEIKENRLTDVNMPKKRVDIMTLKKQGRMAQARIAFSTYKKYQVTRDQYWNLRENLERIKHEIDMAHTNVMATEGFKQANVVMERMLSTTSLADVDSIVDKCRDHMQQGDEIFEALSTPICGDVDEDALDAEMDELIQMGDTRHEEFNLPSIPEEIHSKSRMLSVKHTRGASEALKTPLLLNSTQK